MSRVRLLAAIAIFAGSVSVLGVLLDFDRSPTVYLRDNAYDYASAHALVEGNDPYAPTSELVVREIPAYGPRADDLSPQWHLPLRILIAVPFVGLSFHDATIVWILLMAGCIAGGLYLFARGVGWPRPAALTLGFGVLVVPLVRLELWYANAQGLLLMLLVFAWRQRAKDHAGGWIAAAAALKLYPGFLFLPFIGQRRTRSILIGGAALVVLIVAPWLALGAPTRLFNELGAFGEFRDAWWNISVHRPLAAVPPLAYSISVMLAIAALRPPHQVSGDPFWSAVPLLLLALPLTWTLYLVLAIPWFVITIQNSRGPTRLTYLLIALIAAAHIPSLSHNALALLLTPIALCVGVAIEAVKQRQTLANAEPLRAQ